MKASSVKKYLMIVCSTLTCLSSVPILADWNVDQPYNAEQFYDNGKYGNFPPTDIDQRLSEHLDIVNKPEKGQFRADSTIDSSVSKQSAPVATNPQAPTITSDCAKQNLQQAAYNNYKRGRNPYTQNDQRYNRGTSFSGPWNSNGSNFSGPWNNNGSNFSMPWGNNNGSGFNPMGNGSGWGR